MKRLAAGFVVALAGAALLQSLAQGAPATPAARKQVTIPVPSDGNAAVAHLVLQATKKKGKKTKKAVKRPKLKVLKAPKGVVVAASYIRDKKNKNRWHATVAITNPVGTPPPRMAASASDPGDDGTVVITLIQTDKDFVIVIQGLQLEEDTTFADLLNPPPWVDTFCDPSGSSGDAGLFGDAAPATWDEVLELACALARDEPVPPQGIDDLDLEMLFADLDPFPGNPNEYYVNFTPINIAGANAAAFQFPGHNVVAQLPPTGRTGVLSPGTVTWGNRTVPFVNGQSYRGNARLDGPLTPTQRGFARFSTTYAPPYSDPYPVFGP